MAAQSLGQKALDEVFPNPAVREVAFEIRFSPRLRVNAELWKLQEQLVNEYPNTVTESAVLQPGSAVLSVSVFQNPITGRLIKVSQENVVVAFTKYTCFEDFKAEVLDKAEKFCSTFQVERVTRVGLRYVNNIVLQPSEEPAVLLRFVRPLIDFERVDVDSVEHFISEVRVRYGGHFVTLRGAFFPPLADRGRTYILDIDCHSDTEQAALGIGQALEVYHNSAQHFFLDHITEEYKDVMRGKR